MTTIALTQKTLDLLDKTIKDENASGGNWNRARFIDFLLRTYIFEGGNENE